MTHEFPEHKKPVKKTNMTRKETLQTKAKLYVKKQRNMYPATFKGFDEGNYPSATDTFITSAFMAGWWAKEESKP